MNATANFRILSFVVSVAVYSITGFIWYGNFLFGKISRKEKGITMGGAFPVVP